MMIVDVYHAVFKISGIILVHADKAFMQIEELLENRRSLRSGIFELWLSVTLDAILTLRDQGAYMAQARSWIADQENDF
jgi:hypothetical protein